MHNNCELCAKFRLLTFKDVLLPFFILRFTRSLDFKLTFLSSFCLERSKVVIRLFSQYKSIKPVLSEIVRLLILLVLQLSSVSKVLPLRFKEFSMLSEQYSPLSLKFLEVFKELSLFLEQFNCVRKVFWDISK